MFFQILSKLLESAQIQRRSFSGNAAFFCFYLRLRNKPPTQTTSQHFAGVSGLYGHLRGAESPKGAAATEESGFPLLEPNITNALFLLWTLTALNPAVPREVRGVSNQNRIRVNIKTCRRSHNQHSAGRKRFKNEDK